MNAHITDFADNMLEGIASFVDFEDLTLPVLLVVGECLDHLEVPPMTAFSSLTRTVFPPSKQQDMMNYVS
jgi:hypothetical protein